MATFLRTRVEPQRSHYAKGILGHTIFSRNCPQKEVVSQFDFLGQRHALCWDLATMRAVKYTPQGQIVGSVLELMLGPRSHEQDIS